MFNNQSYILSLSDSIIFSICARRYKLIEKSEKD